jgi:hypothetical protein
MVKNIYGYSWWAIAAVVLNWPWIGISFQAVWLDITTPVGTGRQYFFWWGPWIVWWLTIPIELICWGIAMYKTRASQISICGRGIAWFGFALLLSFPLLALIYSEIR